MSLSFEHGKDPIRLPWYRLPPLWSCGKCKIKNHTVICEHISCHNQAAVIDCLEKPILAGGVEEAVRSLTTFVYLDVEKLIDLAVSAGVSAISRVGWLLSEKKNEWHVSENSLAQLESKLGSGPYRLGPMTKRSSTGWVTRWKLILPEDKEEVESWITHL